jgi:hypothetical protein
MISNVVIGLGETGKPLYDLLKGKYPDTYGYDEKMPSISAFPSCQHLHICLPYQIEDFIGTVIKYQRIYSPEITVVHSTVPIGTTSQIPNAVHSPILGDHTNMEDSLLTFVKWVGGARAVDVEPLFESLEMTVYKVPTPEETEALKLMCLAKYGMSIAFAQYQKDICDKYGFGYSDIKIWDGLYNFGVHFEKTRPILDPPNGKIGGHCVCQGTKLLNDSDPNDILKEILKYA